MSRTTSRALSREMSLRALYQVQIGGVPVREALDGVFQTSRIAVSNPVGQLCAEATQAIRAALGVADRHSLPKDSRARLRVAVALREALTAFAEAAEEIARRLCSPGFPLSVEEACDELRRAADRAREGIGKARERSADLAQGAESAIEIALSVPDKCIASFAKHAPVALAACQYAEALTLGTLSCAEEIDAVLEPRMRGWELDRIAVVDRAILRVALYEMRFARSAPEAVVIDEAVELARKFGGEGAPRFVNGVLGALAEGSRELADVGSFVGANG